MAAQKENLLLLQTNLASSHDLMLLFQQGGLEDAEVKEMITKAKRNFVESHHTLKVSQMHSSSYKNDWWKTYVYDENGKQVIEDNKLKFVDLSNLSIQITFERFHAGQASEF